MAIQTIQIGSVLIPGRMGEGLTASTTAATLTLQTLITFDASTDRAALIHRVPKTGTLTGIEFRTGAVTAAGATVQAQVETVAADGTPSGTPYVANANGTVVVATSDDNVFKAVAINGGTGVSVTRGDLVATVFSISSGTPNTMAFTATPGSSYMSISGFPYVTLDTGGSWAKSSSANYPCWVWNYDGTYEYCDGMAPIDAVTLSTIGNDAERALKFSVPYTMSLAGIRAALCNVSAGADYRVVLYDSTPNILKQIEATPADIDGDVYISTTNDSLATFYFATSQTITAGATYYASIYQKTANNLALMQISVPSSDYMNAIAGGVDFHLATRSGGTGSFSDSAAGRPFISLIPDGFDDGAGSGGSDARRSFLNGGIG